MPLAESWESTVLGMVSQFIIWSWGDGDGTRAADSASASAEGVMKGKSVRRQRGQVFLLSCVGESQVVRQTWPNSWLQGRRTGSSGRMSLAGMVVP